MRYLAVPIMLGLILVNLYIGWRLWKRFFRFIPHVRKAPYWGVLGTLTIAFWIPKFLGGLLPQPLEQALYFIAGYWMCANLYLVLMILAADIVWLVRRRVKPWSERTCKWVYSSIFVITALLVGLGGWQANRIQVTPYEVTVTAPRAQTGHMRIALISDIHLGTVWGAGRVQDIVRRINELEPDVVLISGDLLDDGTGSLHGKEEIQQAFQGLKSTYGTYACLGNHDSGFGKHYNPEETEAFLEGCGIRVLTDEKVLLGDQVLLIGRWDASMQVERKTAAELVDGQTELPIVMLDHQPPARYKDWWKEADRAGVDLVLSGHTHDGQIFPGCLITRMISTCSYGCWKGKNLQAVVTSGVGTWGPTVRIGTKSEIVLIDLRISNEE